MYTYTYHIYNVDVSTRRFLFAPLKNHMELWAIMLERMNISWSHLLGIPTPKKKVTPPAMVDKPQQ